MKSIHERLNLSVNSSQLSSRLNESRRYTDGDDSYIFAPAEPAEARPLVVHRHSGDIVLDRESTIPTCSSMVRNR
jgi:hypothetical protein